ncbi:hypothetical protein ACFVGM_08460 [Kitasatospora purpeofusca]|uniref:hypothetical protein n=1 Tax=Kitasatospora purpeofusca TaxID=67352 RepID=UPI0036A1CEDC
MTSAPANPPPEHRPGLRSADLPGGLSIARRHRRPAVRSAALAAGAVLLFGAALGACKGGVSFCPDDNSCDVAVRTEKADSTHTVEVFGGDRALSLTVGRITDTTAEVELGGDTKTLTEDIETGVGSAKITLRRANGQEHTAELHVVR